MVLIQFQTWSGTENMFMPVSETSLKHILNLDGKSLCNKTDSYFLNLR